MFWLPSSPFINSLVFSKEAWSSVFLEVASWLVAKRLVLAALADSVFLINSEFKGSPCWILLDNSIALEFKSVSVSIFSVDSIFLVSKSFIVSLTSLARSMLDSKFLFKEVAVEVFSKSLELILLASVILDSKLLFALVAVEVFSFNFSFNLLVLSSIFSK